MALDPLKLTITLVATTVPILVLIALLAYTYARYGDPRNLLRQRRLQREARRKAADIEADLKRLEERQVKAQQQIVLETLEGLYQANNLVGSGTAPVGPVVQGRDSYDLAVDPMSYTWGNRKAMEGVVEGCE
jgi:hypothetical protein